MNCQSILAEKIPGSKPILEKKIMNVAYCPYFNPKELNNEFKSEKE
jgi:hypothetical protein